MKDRHLESELLDLLPQDHADAIQARTEMRTVNRVMGNHRWIERMIRRHGNPDWHITELGAGDGSLSLRLMKSRTHRERVLHAVDLAAMPDHWPSGAEWICGDVLDLALPDTEILVANLFLHHFTADQLRTLGARIPPSTRIILAVEPCRKRIHQFLGWCFCRVANLNYVQRHDMQASIRAGFRGDELRQALGLGSEWRTTVSMHPLGGYRFMARRSGLGASLKCISYFRNREENEGGVGFSRHNVAESGKPGVAQLPRVCSQSIDAERVASVRVQPFQRR